MSIAEVIRDRREALRMKQAELAELAGVTERQIGRWESAAQEPTASRCVPLARALGLTLDELHGLIPIGLDLGGRWYACWQTTRGGQPVIDRHTITADHTGAVLRFVADGDYAWTAELRMVDGSLMGTFTAADRGAVQRGTLYLLLGEAADAALGRWSGTSVDTIIGTGWGVLARSEDQADELIDAAIHRGGPPPGWPRQEG